MPSGFGLSGSAWEVMTPVTELARGLAKRIAPETILVFSNETNHCEPRRVS